MNNQVSSAVRIECFFRRLSTTYVRDKDVVSTSQFVLQHLVHLSLFIPLGAILYSVVYQNWVGLFKVDTREFWYIFFFDTLITATFSAMDLFACVLFFTSGTKVSAIGGVIHTATVMLVVCNTFGGFNQSFQDTPWWWRWFMYINPCLQRESNSQSPAPARC